jgi:hypothetical protein
MDQSSLFHGAGGERLQAGVDYPRDTHELMTEGYLRGARRIIDSLSGDGREADFLVYPVVYLYRHWFELRLKDIIQGGRILLQEGSGYPHNHGLHHLWPIARALMEKVWSESERPPQFDLINAAVADFRKFDSDSQSFRYPFNTGGLHPLAALRKVDLEHFSDQMEKIAEFLDAAATGISVYLDAMPYPYETP